MNEHTEEQDARDSEAWQQDERNRYQGFLYNELKFVRDSLEKLIKDPELTKVHHWDLLNEIEGLAMVGCLELDPMWQKHTGQ